MKIWLDINTPSGMFSRVSWDNQTPLPAVGDKVLLRRHNMTWVFGVLERTLSIGYDIATQGPGTAVVLTVDRPAPEGFRL